MNQIDRALKVAGSKFHRIASADSLVWAREKEFALYIVRHNPLARQAAPDSIGQSILQAGSMGLTLNPSLGYCYLVPRRARRRKPGESMAQYEQSVPVIVYATPSYRGLADICQRSGNVTWIRSEVIFMADLFVYKGPAEKPKHIPTIKTSERTERNAIGVYALAKLSGSDYLCEYVDRDTVQKIRHMSDFPNSTMWSPEKLWTEGWKKSAIRRLTKTLPKSSMIDAAIEHLNTYEGISQEGEEQELCISDEQVSELHSMLTDSGFESDRADKWLAKLAKRFGVNRILDLPESKFGNASESLKDALKNAPAHT